MDAFEHLCRARGLPLTVQRRAVFASLAVRRDHPTAEQVHGDVRATLPGISRTTVYRVLETLVQMGLARRIHHQGLAARFDACTHRHHHLICTRCNCIIDLDRAGFEPVLPLPEAEDGFRITDYSISFQGVCSLCQGKENPT